MNTNRDEYLQKHASIGITELSNFTDLLEKIAIMKRPVRSWQLGRKTPKERIKIKNPGETRQTPPKGTGTNTGNYTNGPTGSQTFTGADIPKGNTSGQKVNQNPGGQKVNQNPGGQKVNQNPGGQKVNQNPGGGKSTNETVENLKAEAKSQPQNRNLFATVGKQTPIRQEYGRVNASSIKDYSANTHAQNAIKERFGENATSEQISLFNHRMNTTPEGRAYGDATRLYQQAKKDYANGKITDQDFLNIKDAHTKAKSRFNEVHGYTNANANANANSGVAGQQQGQGRLSRWANNVGDWVEKNPYKAGFGALAGGAILLSGKDREDDYERKYASVNNMNLGDYNNMSYYPHGYNMYKTAGGPVLENVPTDQGDVEFEQAVRANIYNNMSGTNKVITGGIGKGNATDTINLATTDVIGAGVGAAAGAGIGAYLGGKKNRALGATIGGLGGAVVGGVGTHYLKTASINPYNNNVGDYNNMNYYNYNLQKQASAQQMYNNAANQMQQAEYMYTDALQKMASAEYMYKTAAVDPSVADLDTHYPTDGGTAAHHLWSNGPTGAMGFGGGEQAISATPAQDMFAGSNHMNSIMMNPANTVQSYAPATVGGGISYAPMAGAALGGLAGATAGYYAGKKFKSPRAGAAIGGLGGAVAGGLAGNYMATM